MRYRYRNPVEQSEGDVSPLQVLGPVILERECRPDKDLLHITKIDTVVLEVQQPLRLIPLISHLRSVYTIRTAGNVVPIPSNPLT